MQRLLMNGMRTLVGAVVGCTLTLNASFAAAPTLVNSLSAAQFPGIEADSLSSVYVKNGVLWITDETGVIHKWKAGQRASSFITDSDDRRFSSAIHVSKDRLLATDVRSGELVLGRNNVWQVFGGSGDLEGETKRPVATAWSENGLIYVAEAGNQRISVFSDGGLFLFTFGDSSSLPAMNLGEVRDLGIDRTGRVYVLDDTHGGRISVFTSVGEKIAEIGKGELLTLLQTTVRITAMAVRADGVIIIADQRNGRIFEIDWESMTLLSSFGTTGRGRGQFQRVSGLALDDDGKLYVADKGNEKIEIFQLDWQQPSWIKRDADMLSIHQSSVLMSACDVSYIYAAEQMLCLNKSEDTVDFRSHDGVVLKALVAKFDNPIRAVFDSKEMFVLDDEGVKVFDAQGNWKFEFASEGGRKGEISDAANLILTKSSVYIADTGNKRVQKFSRNGLFQQVIGKKTPLAEPIAVVVDQRGNLYVADKELGKVLVYSAKGELITQIGAEKEQPSAFKNIYDLYIDEENILYVMTSMENNDLSVWMYKDSKFLYRFSPTKQVAKAGFDKQWLSIFSAKKDSTVNDIAKSAESALNSVVDLTLGTALELFQGGGFFSKQDWVFNTVPNNPSLISLVDLENHARHTFTILRVPKQVRDISISGDKDTVKLNWLASSKDFSGYYTVYGRQDISSPFEVIEQTPKPTLSLQRKPSDPIDYRISAMSALGKEGKLSAVYQDEFWVGYLAFQNKDYDKALTMLNQAKGTNPNHAAAWLYLGQAQMALGDYDDAMGTFKQLSQFKTLKSEAFHWQAKALIAKKEWLDVKALVDDAEGEGNADALLFSMAADALIRLDDIPSAIYYLNQAVRLEPSSAIWHLALAGANFELGARDSAIRELEQAGKLAGRDVNAWIEVARTYNKHQLVTDAIASYGRALNIEPAHAQALPELAILQLAQNNLDNARALATKMASIKALKGTSYYILGRVALADKKAPQALTFLAKAGRTDPNNANIWLFMANAYAALGKNKREKEYLLKAVALDDDNFDVHFRLGRTCVAQKDTVCAKMRFERAVELDERSVVARLGLAETLMNSGKLVEASGHVLVAIKYDSESVTPLLLLADIQSSRGMIPDSIATLKKAMILDDANMEVHLHLAKAYISNHLYDDAQQLAEQAMLLDVRNAAPLILMGNIYIARQLFDDAITSFGKAVELMPNHAKYRQYLNIAYQQKKRMVDAGGKMLGPKLKQLHFSRIFSAAYKQYTDVPVGTLIVKNEAGVDYSNIKISLFVKEYMDFPTTTVVDRVPANGQVEVNLLAAFNNKILDIDEDTGVQTEVKAEYYLAGKPHEETLNESMTIYGKNAIVWDKLDMVGSFVTPKDEALAVFTRQLVNAYDPAKGAVNARVSKAMTVYNGLSAYGIKYLVDPNTPYGNLDALQMDTVQFPRETLRQRSGDCDDLSILLAAAFANLGIETAILDVPAHLLMMFNTGVPESRKDSISLNDEAIAILDGQVWIPLEATLIAASFTEAWAEGARKYHLYGKASKMKIMPLAKAWENYTPVTLPPAEFALDIPDKGMVGDKITKEWGILSVKALERQVRPYRVMLALDPQDAQAQMQIAVVYARNGLLTEASVELNRIHESDPNNIAALNNLGNIQYMRHDYEKALKMYQKALHIEPNNADIMVNITMTHYKMGDSRKANDQFALAVEQDEQVPVRYEQLALLLGQ